MLPGNAKWSMTSLADTKHIFRDLWSLEFRSWLRPRAVSRLRARFARDTIIKSLRSELFLYKYIMCLQMKFYATIEPYIYIIILPIMREEIGGLVPKIMFEFWIRHDVHNYYRIHGPSCNGCRVCDTKNRGFDTKNTVDTKTFSSTKESGKYFLSLFPWFSRIDDSLLQHIGLF